MPTIKYENAAGQRIKGTTGIAKYIDFGSRGALMGWANKGGRDGKTLQEMYDTATIPGTICHHLIESELKNQPPDLIQYSEEDIAKGQTAFDNFHIWCEQFKFKPVAVEPNLISEVYQYGGTPDVIAEVQGKLTLVDWKTGKNAGKYPEIFVQLAAYEQLIYENGYGAVEGFHVLRIPRDEDIPSFAHFYWERLPPEAWEAFMCALNVCRITDVLKKYI